MALSKLTYATKVALNPQPDIADENKVTDSDMNEIKTVVNDAIDQVDTNTTSIENFGKELWSGTFSSGTISAPGANNYTFYIVWLDVGSYGVACIGTKAYGLGGIEQYGSYSSSIYSYRLGYNSSTEEFIISNNDRGGSDGTQNIPIKAIYGLF